MSIRSAVTTPRRSAVIGALAVAALVAGCGADPADPGAATDGPTSAPGDVVARCAEPPFGDTAGPNPDDGDSNAASAAAASHGDLFAGVWWDGAAQEFVFTAVDVDRAATVLAGELDPAVAHRVELVAHSDQELAAIQARVPELGLEASSGRRVWDAIVEIDLPILDDASLDAVLRVFAGDLDAICVTGADPATVPPEGPQPTEGDGWRLLADQQGRGVPYTVHVAVNAAEYESLWASLALDGEPMAVDFDREIVVHFGVVYSGSCPEIRLDDVVIDVDAATVDPEVVRLGGDRMCTDDANPRAYLVAIARDHLPAVPFTVGLGITTTCLVCETVTVDDLRGSDAPVAQLSHGDLWQVLGAVALQRVGIDNSFGGDDVFTDVMVVDTLGRADADGFVDDAGGRALTDDERNAITAALAPRRVQFVTAAEARSFEEAHMTGPVAGTGVLTLAEPRVIDGQVTVTSSVWCGGLCATGGAHVVERVADGSWVVTGVTGPQWIS